MSCVLYTITNSRLAWANGRLVQLYRSLLHMIFIIIVHKFHLCSLFLSTPLQQQKTYAWHCPLAFATAIWCLEFFMKLSTEFYLTTRKRKMIKKINSNRYYILYHVNTSCKYTYDYTRTVNKLWREEETMSSPPRLICIWSFPLLQCPSTTNSDHRTTPTPPSSFSLKRIFQMKIACHRKITSPAVAVTLV